MTTETLENAKEKITQSLPDDLFATYRFYWAGLSQHDKTKLDKWYRDQFQNR